MKIWIGSNYWLVTFVLAFIFYALFGNVILFLTILAVIGVFITMKGVYKTSFYLFEWGFLGLFLLLSFICLLFGGGGLLEIFVIITGLWFICSIFIKK